MKDTRPINLDLTAIKWPLPAITSILHRISGVVIFFGVAVLLYLLDVSLASPEGFAQVTHWLTNPIVKFIAWAILAGLLYHLVAGFKHLLMDLGIGETMAGSTLGAQITLVVSAIAIIAAGMWIW